MITAFKAWADGLGFGEVDAAIAVARAVTTFEVVQAWHAALEDRFARE